MVFVTGRSRLAAAEFAFSVLPLLCGSQRVAPEEMRGDLARADVQFASPPRTR